MAMMTNRLARWAIGTLGGLTAATGYSASITYTCTLSQFHNGNGVGTVSGWYDIMSEAPPLKLTFGAATADIQYTEDTNGVRGLSAEVRRSSGDRLGGDAIVYEPVQHFMAYDFEFDAADHYNVDCVRAPTANSR
jgi:hypothetical protein